MTEPLVLIPGLNCTAALFGPQIAAVRHTRDIIVADHRSDDSVAAIAARFLRSAPATFALAGLSMGGYIALEIMRMAPQRVTRLALMDTNARPDTQEATDRRLRLIEIAGQDYSRIHPALWPNLVALHRAGDQGLEAIVRTMAEDTGPEAFVRQERAIMGRVDSRPSLAQIAVPTLVLVGELDTLTPPDLAREMANAINGSELVVVKNVGHLSTLEEPDTVNAALNSWLARAA